MVQVIRFTLSLFSLSAEHSGARNAKAKTFSQTTTSVERRGIRTTALAGESKDLPPQRWGDQGGREEQSSALSSLNVIKEKLNRVVSIVQFFKPLLIFYFLTYYQMLFNRHFKYISVTINLQVQKILLSDFFFSFLLFYYNL